MCVVHIGIAPLRGLIGSVFIYGTLLRPVFLFVLISLVVAGLSVDGAIEPTCLLADCGEDFVRAASLLQINKPPRHRVSALQTSSNFHVDAEALDPRATELSIETSDALRTEVNDFMQNAAEQANQAQLGMAAGAERATQMVQAIENMHENNKEALVAQDVEARKAAEAGEALLGAMQRVQHAGQVESQEQSIAAVATQRLQQAAAGARKVQVLEDEGAAQDARAAELLQEAIHKLERSDPGDGTSILLETLKVVGEAQKVVAAKASSKIHASQLLQTSLEGAAVAAEALKGGSEEHTATWLRDALRILQRIQGSWRQRTQAELEVARNLESAASTSDSVQQLAESTAASMQSGMETMHGVAQAVRAAQDVASQEATTAALVQEEAEAREAEMDKTLQEARREVQLAQSESAPQMSAQAMSTDGLAQIPGGLPALMQILKASSDLGKHQALFGLPRFSQAAATPPALIPQRIPAAGSFEPAAAALPQVSQLAMQSNYMPTGIGAPLVLESSGGALLQAQAQAQALAQSNVQAQLQAQAQAQAQVQARAQAEALAQAQDQARAQAMPFLR
jgi:hypothetical protein